MKTSRLLFLLVSCAITFAVTAQSPESQIDQGRTLRQARETDQSLESQIDQGRTLRLAGQIEQSIKALNDVLAKDPTSFRAQYNLALALSSTEKKDAAETAFQKTIQLGEAQGMPDPTIYNSYGWFLMTQGNLPAAKVQLDKGLAYLDRLPSASQQRLLNNLGVWYMQTRQLDLAQRTFQRAATEFGSSGAQKNLQVVEQAKRDAQQASPSAVTGLVYLGQTTPTGSEWVAGTQTMTVNSASSIKAGDNLTVSKAVNIHAESAANGASVPGASFGVLKAGDVAKVVDLRKSTAPNGGNYVWAKVVRDESGAAL